MPCFQKNSKEPSVKELQVEKSPVYLSFAGNEVHAECYKAACLREHEIYEKLPFKSQISDVPIHNFDQNETHYIHTVFFPAHRSQEDLESRISPVVLLHGFGGTSLSFFKVVQHLNDRDVYALDFLGMGLSSRPIIPESLSVEEMIGLFVESIEAWRVQVGIERFNLVGHSFGGYMGFHYALKYSQHVEQLTLASPMGISRNTEEDFKEKVKQIKQGFLKRHVFSVFEKYWNNKRSVASVLDMTLIPKSIILSVAISKHLRIQDNLKAEWKEYIICLMKLPVSTDICIYSLVRFPLMCAVISIEETLEKAPVPLPFNVTFIYGGERDWMCKLGAQRIVEAQNTPCQMQRITLSTHQIPFNTPEDLAAIIKRNIQQPV